MEIDLDSFLPGRRWKYTNAENDLEIRRKDAIRDLTTNTSINGEKVFAIEKKVRQLS